MAFQQTFAANILGRDFVIGDLHGMVSLLHEQLDAVLFDRAKDRCFSVGDLVDRGPDSPAAARLVMEDWFHAVRGNHEDMLIRAVEGERGSLLKIWRQNGGQWGQSWWRPNPDAEEAAELCRQLPFAITLTHRRGWRIGICHAQCPVDDWAHIETIESDEDRISEMLWGRSRIFADNPPSIDGIDLTIHGHTVIQAPMLRRNALFIDTGASVQGSLTLLCLDDWIGDHAKDKGRLGLD